MPIKSITSLDIEGLKVITPQVFGDSRGYFKEHYVMREYREAGIETNFIQDNVSKSTKSVLRGLHFQINFPQAKLVSVLSGAVYDLALDLREGSPSFGEHYGLILSEENHKQFYIPEGFAHGFCVLSDTAIFSYKCSDYYHPNDEGGIYFNDPKLDILWPDTGENYILSDKDKLWPSLDDYLKNKLHG